MKLERDFRKLSPKMRLYYKTLFKKDFYTFVQYFWEEADPAPFVDGVLVQFYCEFFQYLCRPWIGYDGPEEEPVLPEISEDINIIDVRQDKQNGNVNVPPRHSKSSVLNVLSGPWAWINMPIKLASISHTGNLATSMNSKRQKILNSERFKFFFPEITLDVNSSHQLTDERGAEMYSVARSAALGYGADILVCDDLTNDEAARKDKEEMSNSWEFFHGTLPTRINNQNKYIILNIQQRLAQNDITGRILADEALSSQYIHVVLPAQFAKTTYLVMPISGKVHKFEKGDFLWPERFGDYSGLRAQVGETSWQTKYLQNPIATDKTYIKEEMLREENATDCYGWDAGTGQIEETKVDMVYAAHDFPVKDKITSDFLGSVLAYRVKKVLYIVDCYEAKQAFTENLAYVKGIDSTYRGSIQIIEDKANGSPLLTTLQDEVPGMQGYDPGTNSKEDRVSLATQWLNNVVFVKTRFNKLNNKWELSPALQNLKQRLINFPFVDHDDIVDAWSMLILYVFLDLKYCVYGKSFTDANMIASESEKCDYSTVFFNKEGDTWKVLDLGIKYGEIPKVIVLRETVFVASVESGLRLLKDFAPDKNVFIDCSLNSLGGIYTDDVICEAYSVANFELSVTQLSLALSNKRVLLDHKCKLCKTDIESFKYDTKDAGKFRTNKDGFVACLRVAMHYYGGIVYS